ncbi:MAG: TatD family hydrolase [Bacteroidales bacterium]|nr:TatD family hydrolase [Bacteroidales bacterium]MCL2739190.1 TatD family hydrolase [Bacteroidales bacterium]
MLIDTHCHLYADAFDSDRKSVVERAIQAGVQRVILPGIDKKHHPALMRTLGAFPEFCLPAIGLHPTSVDAGYKVELEFVAQQLKEAKYTAIGEIGIDGYWSREFMAQQREAFEQQIEWAAAYDLPVIIHSRNSFDELFEILYRRRSLHLRGVFHAFSGSYEQFKQLQKCGDFSIGIGGVLTYKNAGLAQTVAKIAPSFLLLETDAPWLAPVPHRGQRNESAHLIFIALRLSELLEKPFEEIASITTQNACRLFRLSYLCTL